MAEDARRRAEEAARLRAQRRPALIVMVLLVLAALGWFANRMRKGRE